MSAILASFLPGVLLTHFGKDNAVSFFYAKPGVLGPLRGDADVRLVLYLGARARSVVGDGAAGRGGERNLSLAQSLNRLFIELTSTLRIKIFRQHLGMYLGGYIAQDVFNAVFTYYVVFV
nr:Rhamnogalacturonide transporter RhiT [Raoultella sp. NCTC 9187]